MNIPILSDVVAKVVSVSTEVVTVVVESVGKVITTIF